MKTITFNMHVSKINPCFTTPPGSSPHWQLAQARQFTPPPPPPPITVSVCLRAVSACPHLEIRVHTTDNHSSIWDYNWDKKCFSLYAPHEINHRKWGSEVLIFEITASCLPSPTQNMSCLFLSLPTYLLNIMVSTTQTLAQIKPREFIGHIKEHFMAISPLTDVTNSLHDFVECCFKSCKHDK